MALPLKIQKAFSSLKGPFWWRWFWRARLHFWDWHWRFKMAWTERSNLCALTDNIHTARESLLKARLNGHSDAERVINICLFVSLTLRDLSVLRSDIGSPFDNWRSRYGARQTAMVVFEAVEDLTQMLGKDFRETIRRVDPAGLFLNEVNRIGKRLGCFLQFRHEILERTRNAIAAHREHDSIRFLELVEDLDPEEIKVISVECIEIFTDLIRTLNLVLENLSKRIPLG